MGLKRVPESAKIRFSGGHEDVHMLEKNGSQGEPWETSLGRKKTHAAAATVRSGHGAGAGDEVGKRPLELISSL